MTTRTKKPTKAQLKAAANAAVATDAQPMPLPAPAVEGKTVQLDALVAFAARTDNFARGGDSYTKRAIARRIVNGMTAFTVAKTRTNPVSRVRGMEQARVAVKAACAEAGIVVVVTNGQHINVH